MGFGVTRQRIREILNDLVEWGDAEDADMLLDVLLERTDLDGAYTWLFFHNQRLGGTPLHMMESGRSREVFVEARRLVAEA